MKVSHFVSASSVILAGWLVLTFVRDVPSQRYPKLEKYPATTASKAETELEPVALDVKSVDLPVSVSR